MNPSIPLLTLSKLVNKRTEIIFKKLKGVSLWFFYFFFLFFASRDSAQLFNKFVKKLREFYIIIHSEVLLFANNLLNLDDIYKEDIKKQMAKVGDFSTSNKI